jgi:hypothetical protein
MFWRATSLGAAVLLVAASAQTPQGVTMPPASPRIRTETERALRELVKNYRLDTSAVCSIPLTEVPVAKTVERKEPIRILRPPKPVESMPLVPLPAPPCQEEKR